MNLSFHWSRDQSGFVEQWITSWIKADRGKRETVCVCEMNLHGGHHIGSVISSQLRLQSIKLNEPTELGLNTQICMHAHARLTNTHQCVQVNVHTHVPSVILLHTNTLLSVLLWWVGGGMFPPCLLRFHTPFSCRPPYVTRLPSFHCDATCDLCECVSEWEEGPFHWSVITVLSNSRCPELPKRQSNETRKDGTRRRLNERRGWQY